MHRGGLLIRLRGTTPHNDDAVEVVFGLKALDVGHELHGEIKLVGSGLDPLAVETRHPPLVKHRIHSDNALKLA